MKNVKQSVKFIFFAWIVFVTIQLQAQEKRFIYIQSENKQPFYAQINNQTFSSTAGGYLIIAQLTPGKYSLVTGFAKNQYPEQKFKVDITSGDAGFSLKQNNDKEWGLFDLVNLNSIMADNRDTGEIKREGVAALTVEKDTASVSLAPDRKAAVPVDSAAGSVDSVSGGAVVTNKSSLIENKKDTVTTATAPVKEAANPANSTLIKTAEASSSQVIKTFEKPGDQGVDQIYVDRSNSRQDTIALFIPKEAAPATLAVKKQEPVPVTIPEKNRTGKCTVQASDRDFYQTRLSLAAATSDESMMLAARTAFESKCYSTKQVKYLGMLFLSERSRYNFLALAKPFVFDPENFPSLLSQFTEPDIIQKFRVLIKKK